MKLQSVYDINVRHLIFNITQTLKLLSFWFFFLMVFGEAALRIIGYQPGVFLQPRELQNNWVNLDGEKPTLLNLFQPDSFGLFKATVPPPALEMEDSNYYLLSEKLAQSRFNSDGFRSCEFNHSAENKTTVLFIGDSFTFGFDAQPFDRSFVDLVGQINPCIHALNAGIPGADLATYAKVADLYIPKVQPDIVIVCLYVNDMVFYPKKIIPGEINDIYMTDKGVLFKENNFYKKDSIQVFDNHEEAYRALLSDFTTNYIQPKRLKWILEHSVLLAQVYEWLDLSWSQRFGTIYEKVNHAQYYTEQIKETAIANGAVPIFTIIPHRSNLDKADNLELFQQMVTDTLYFPKGIAESHYGTSPRIHFNNRGHQFYAQFLNEVLEGLAY